MPIKLHATYNTLTLQARLKLPGQAEAARHVCNIVRTVKLQTSSLIFEVLGEKGNSLIYVQYNACDKSAWGDWKEGGLTVLLSVGILWPGVWSLSVTGGYSEEVVTS